MDTQKHKIIMSKVLMALYKNRELSDKLWFKGGTCAMFFYDLPRFSVDLDFDWLWWEENDHTKYLDILESEISKFGKISDKKDKFYTIYYELNYQPWAKNLKIEISKRGASGWFLVNNFMWENILIMNQEDLFTNKIFALLNRKNITNRDIFDVRYFLQAWVNLNKQLLESKLEQDNTTYQWYIDQVKEFISSYDFQKILYGLGELVDPDQKQFAKTKMKSQILWYLDFL